MVPFPSSGKLRCGCKIGPLLTKVQSMIMISVVAGVEQRIMRTQRREELILTLEKWEAYGGEDASSGPGRSDRG